MKCKIESKFVKERTSYNNLRKFQNWNEMSGVEVKEGERWGLKRPLINDSVKMSTI